MNDPKTVEEQRLASAYRVPWKLWGPYLSERQWGTVREDYSEGGDAWNYFTHDQARSRAYRWGEDGLGGISDDKQRLCFALALWNGRDPILKERLFGLTNTEGNHGEDVKEYYFYLDSTPTHSYMKYLYKYPQNAYPYTDLAQTNRGRNRYEFEYELLDTGIFRENRYFDVYIEYAKAAPQDILIKITAVNRGPESAVLHILPTLWFHNTWTWDGSPKPSARQAVGPDEVSIIEAEHHELGRRFLVCADTPNLLFTENETNNWRLFGGNNASPYVKDGINDYVVNGQSQAINPAQRGTKAAAHYQFEIGGGQEAVVQLRLRDEDGVVMTNEIFGARFDELMKTRQDEADDFYRSITPAGTGEDEARVMRQAFAGMLWSKQYYTFNLDRWLEEHAAHPLRIMRRRMRNQDWFHMDNSDIISMPDKWEYPWFAAWDLAFHAVSFSAIDLDFAEQQLNMMLRELYLHPNGQIPAYEWNFSDVNPPVHAWASLFIYHTQRRMRGEGDINFLKHTFNKLMANFTWWVNRKDRDGRNVFEGGFLGLDNIGVFDRSAPLPTGGYLEQADGTAWMSMFCQNMLEMSMELAAYDSVYDDLAPKFADHFILIAQAINHMGGSTGTGLWDEKDGFYYDVLRLPDGQAVPLKVRSMVGLLPLCATTILERYQRDHVPHLLEHVRRRASAIRDMRAIHPTGEGQHGVNDRVILALVNPDRLRSILAYLLDENEFLSPYGIRSLSRYHAEHPYAFWVNGQKYEVNYLPAESNSGMFGGNSNWRGPIWFPMNTLIIQALLNFYLYYGDSFKVECPTGSGNFMNLFEVARELVTRLTKIFIPNEQGQRPVYGGTEKFQHDPHWKDNILFFEYFHGDNGAGLGASHQTGWTGLIAPLIKIFNQIDAKTYLEVGGKRYKEPEPSMRAAGQA